MEYQNGYRVKPNLDEAMKWQRKAVENYRKAAENGNVYAMVDLFSSYQFGWSGVEKNAEEARKWFNKAVESGDPVALIALGNILFIEGDEKQRNEVSKLFSQAAEQEWAVKQYPSTLWYYKKGTEAERFRWAAESGDAQLQYKIATTWIAGGRNLSETERAEWLGRAAENGNAKMSYDIAMKFYFGEGGVQKNYAEAFKWFYKAATEGLTMMTTDYMPNKLINWYADACQKLGTMYAEGQGVPQNRSEGEKWAILLINNKTTMNEWGPALAKWEKETLEKVNARWRQINPQ